MTESPAPYNTGARPEPFRDPQIVHICGLLHYHVITLDEAVRRLTELQQRRLLEFQAGWIVVDRDIDYEVLVQVDEFDNFSLKGEV